MKLVEKGNYGYVDSRKKVLMILTIICFAIVFTILFIGIIVCKTKNNIMTVFAILTVLPSAKVAVSWLMFVRYQSPKKEDYEKLVQQADKLPILSDCLMTCKDKTIYVDFAVITDATIYCYTRNANFDEAYFEKNVVDFIKSCGDTITVKLYKDFDAFVKKAHAANANENKEGKMERVKNDFLILVL